MSVIVAMGKFTPVQTEYAIKDSLPKGASHITAHIVVGTPGTMIDLMRRKVIDISEVKVFVLDEADNMLDQDGLGDQTLRVKKCVFSHTPQHNRRQLMPLSFAVCFQKEGRCRSFYSRPRFPIMSATLRASSHRMRTKSNSRRTSYL
jgi:hypothetical protein